MISSAMAAGKTFTTLPTRVRCRLCWGLHSLEVYAPPRGMERVAWRVLLSVLCMLVAMQLPCRLAIVRSWHNGVFNEADNHITC